MDSLLFPKLRQRGRTFTPLFLDDNLLTVATWQLCSIISHKWNWGVVTVSDRYYVSLPSRVVQSTLQPYYDISLLCWVPFRVSRSHGHIRIFNQDPATTWEISSNSFWCALFILHQTRQVVADGLSEISKSLQARTGPKGFYVITSTFHTLGTTKSIYIYVVAPANESRERKFPFHSFWTV